MRYLAAQEISTEVLRKRICGQICNMDSLLMQIQKSASFVLLADGAENAKRFSESIDQSGQTDWQIQCLVVDSHANSGVSPSVDGSAINRFNSLGQAITAAEHSLIAVFDAGQTFDPMQWQRMANLSETAPIQSSFCLPRPNRNYIRGLLWLYSLVVRLLGGTGKSELHSGLTVFQRGEVQPLLSKLKENQDSDDGSFAVTRLLSLARLNGIRIVETSVEGEWNPAPQPLGVFRIARAFQNMLRFWWNQIMFPRRQSELTIREPKPLTKLAAVALLLGIAGFMLFQNLDYPLFEPDESRNSQLAINIIESGQWMSLTLADESYWDKPPFQMWAVAASYKLFGVSQFATRLPIAIAALMTLMFTLLLGKRLIGFQAAWIGAFLLLLSCGFVVAGRYLTMDASLTAMVTAMLLLGFTAISDEFSKRHALAAGIACGFGILIKGPVIGVLCLPPLLMALWLSPEKQPFPLRRWLWFAVPAFVISAPWFIATAIIHPDFLTYFFWKHNVVRFSNAFNHREPFWYYFIGIFLFMFPASYLIPSVTKFLTSRKPENRLLRTREQGFLFLSAIWIIGFFSISESKLPTYILPSFPMICLLIGVLMDRKIFNCTEYSVELTNHQRRNPPQRPAFLDRLTFHAPAGVALWSAVIGLVTFVFFTPDSAPIAFLVAGGIFLSVITAIAVTNQSKPKIAWVCFGLLGLFWVGFATQSLIPAVSSTRSIHSAARTIRSSDEFENAPVVFFGRETYGASLTLNEEFVFSFAADETQAMVEFLTEHPTAIIVSSEDPMETLRRDLPWTILLEEREDARHLYVSRWNKAVIARQPDSTLNR